MPLWILAPFSWLLAVNWRIAWSADADADGR